MHAACLLMLLTGCVADVLILSPIGLDGKPSLGEQEARAERKAQVMAMARTLSRVAAEAAAAGDCEKVHKLAAEVIALPPPDHGDHYHDLFVLDRDVERCLGLEACREMRSLMREQPELAGDPRVQARYAKCPAQPTTAPRVKTERERCLEARGDALRRAQLISDPTERGRVLRSIPVCPTS